MKTPIESVVQGIVEDKPSQVIANGNRLLDSHLDQINTLVSEGVVQSLSSIPSKTFKYPTYTKSIASGKTVTESAGLKSNPLDFLHVDDTAIVTKYTKDIKEFATKKA